MMGMAQEFIDALRALEQGPAEEPNVGALQGVFSEREPTIRTPNFSGEGQEEVARFWREYRTSFRDVRSDFHVTLEEGNSVALEWTSRGTLVTGEPFEYSGSTFLSRTDDGVASFRSYFDPRALSAHA